MPLGDPAAVDLKALRAAVFTDNGIIPATVDRVQAVDDAAKALSNAGISVTETRPEGIVNRPLTSSSGCWVQMVGLR